MYYYKIFSRLKIFIFLLFLLNCKNRAFAEDIANNKATMLKNGTVEYEVIDTTKTSGTTWSTVGFTVKNAPTYGDPTANPKGTFIIMEDNKYSIEYPNGKTKTTFTFPSDYVKEQFNKAKVTAKTLKENDNHVFLNGILQVYHNGNPYGASKKTLAGIQNAESWKNKKDFEDRFDIKLPYNFESDKQPVYLTIMKYSSKGYTFVSRKKIAEASSKKTYTTKTADISGSIISNTTGNTLYLYRTHWAKMSGPETSHSNGKYRTPKDVKKTNISPLLYWQEYKSSLQVLRNREYDLYDKGIEIVCTYKNPTKKEEIENETDICVDLIEPYVTGSIQAESMGAEQFNSEEGIPTTEYQYVNVQSKEYLTQYAFRHYSGTKTYMKRIPADPSDPKSKEELKPVTRNYSYWKIVDLNIYKISGAEVENYSLPGTIIHLSTTASYKSPVVSYNVYGNNMEEPSSGGVEVGHIRVRNDRLIFNGQTVMNGSWCSTSTSRPGKIPISANIDQTALYRSNLVIDRTKANGEYDSDGTITYSRICHYGGDAEGADIEYDMEELNNVIIHTPVVCDAKITDVRKYNQMLRPDQSVPSLVLDTDFAVTLPTEGYHSRLKGYQYRDYAKYTASREMKFPFDVYLGTVYKPAGSWISIDTDHISFYLPVWVTEGVYTIEFRTRAINCDANNGLLRSEELANGDYNNYVAADTIDVQVSGRMYGLSLYDISDYPVWQNVFRKPESLHFTGFNYTVGTNDRNGEIIYDAAGKVLRSGKYTIPLVKGSHPEDKNAGIIKPGYCTRFSIRTIGNYGGDKDFIHIVPSFYFVDPLGKNRQKVDLYYTETFDTTRKRTILVKAGSEKDLKNQHRLNRKDPYLLTPQGEPASQDTEKDVYSYSEIAIPNTLMSFVGDCQFDAKVKPENSNIKKLQKNVVQLWNCEYHLPSVFYVCPKGYDVKQYVNKHGGLDFKEDFWLKTGYVIVNFEIESVRNGEPYLSYINAQNTKDGYCNMWKMEGGETIKTDADGNKFFFLDGDYALYHTMSNGTVRKDYRAKGIY